MRIERITDLGATLFPMQNVEMLTCVSIHAGPGDWLSSGVPLESRLPLVPA